jgi:hypothetical protein
LFFKHKSKNNFAGGRLTRSQLIYKQGQLDLLLKAGLRKIVTFLTKKGNFLVFNALYW